MLPVIQNVQVDDHAEINSMVNLNNCAIPAVNSLTACEMQYLVVSSAYSKSLMLDRNLIGFMIALGPGVTSQSPNYQWFSEYYGKFIYIDRIVIAPLYQGNGFGRMLYKGLTQFSSKQCPRMTCEVNLRPRNERSLEFHRKYGFRSVGSQIIDSGEIHVLLLEYLIRS